MSVEKQVQELDSHLQRWVRWVRMRRGVAWAGRGLTLGLAVALA